MDASSGLSTQSGAIHAVCVSTTTGTAKQPVPSADFIANTGLQNDGHAGSIRQVSLLMSESVARFNTTHQLAAGPGDFAENLQTCGFDLGGLRVGDRLRIGTALLEVTQIGKEVLPHHYSFHGYRLLPTEGVFCRVLSDGTVGAGTAVIRVP